MAYVAGLYTGASRAAADEAQRFRQFQTQIDDMSARERAGLYRRDQAAMDQFTAGLKPQSNVALPDLTLPSAPPMPASSLPKTGGGADSGAAAQTNYERDRALEQRKILANQYNSEIGALKSILTDLGKQKYILEQQLSIAPAYQQQSIRNRLSGIEKEISTTMQSGRERVLTIGNLVTTIDDNIRTGDFNRMAGLVQPGQLYTPEMLPNVAPEPEPSMVQFPTGTAVPEQVVAPSLTEPAAATGTAPRTRLADLPPYVVDTSPRAPTPPGGGGYTSQPEASVIGNVAGEYRANQRAIIEYNRLRGSLMTNVFGDIGSWFGSQKDYDKRQQMKARNSEALQWYESSAVRDFMTSNPAAIAEAQRDPVGYYQRNKSKIGKETATGVAGGPTPVADAVAAGTAAAPGQAQTIPEPDSMGVTNVSAPAPLEVPAAVPVKDEAFAAQSAAKLESEFLPRVAEIPQMMTTGTVQQLVKRATELGVDPAAAVAIYGVETNFGRRVGVSEKGAFGVMQVTPATFEGMKRFFTDPAEIKKYNIPQALVSAAANMSADDANSFDAGLLRMKYAEYKGVDKNLLGAGYNASAETIARLGRPLATGAGITNEDYNKAYIALYNEARNYVGLEGNMPMQAFKGAPLRLQELDATEQIEITNYNNELNVLQQQNQRILDRRNIIAQQISFAQQSGFFNQIPALQQQLVELDGLLMGVTQQANQLNAGYQSKFNEFNMQRTREFGNIAVGRMLGGDPAPLSEMWSRATGQPVTIQRRSDGKYNIFMGADGRRISPADGMTPDAVANEFRIMFDDAYAAEESTRRQAERDAAVQHDRKLQELMIQQVGDIEVAKINKAPVTGFSKPEPVRYDQTTGLAIEFVSYGEGIYEGQIIRYRSPPQQELKDGILTIDQAIITRERAPGLQ